jgi:hypothetical protein
MNFSFLQLKTILGSMFTTMRLARWVDLRRDNSCISRTDGEYCVDGVKVSFITIVFRHGRGSNKAKFISHHGGGYYRS